MKSYKKSPETQVTVEQLLRLKRSEKPEADFWERFDRELHGRMLRTLVNSESEPAAGWSRWLRMRWLQASAATACVALAAVFVLELQFLDSTTSTSVVAHQTDGAEAADFSAASSFTDDSNKATPAVAVERTDFGIGRVASAKPVSEASFSRDFGANAVRVAAAMPVDSYRMDYASDSIFGDQSARGRLVY